MYRTLYRMGIVVVILVLTCAATYAGPPLICFPFEVDGAETVPWGKGPFDVPEQMNQSRFFDRVVDRLDADKSVIVHMETLRRATLFCDRDRGAASELLTRILARTLDAEATDDDGVALAWFDAAFLAQSMDQMGMSCVNDLTHGTRDAVVGYNWMRHALKLRPDDARMHFAAGLMAVMYDKEQCEEHLAQARAGAANDPLLARNLEMFQDELLDRFNVHPRSSKRSDDR